MPATLTPAQILKQFFGYDRFRPLQAEAIGAAVSGRDVLLLMPTGGGKSVCYQVPALALPGLTVVVSPLIALMKDQVDALLSNGIPAAYINSSLAPAERTQVDQLCREGKMKLLYVSPEKLLSPSFLQWLQGLQLSLFAIDEAHCISAWGHDFRAEYTQLKAIKEYFPAVPIMALTATADKLIRKDILDQLELRNPAVLVSSFDRPNLSLTVRPGRGRLGQILDFLAAHPGEPGIIYCLSRSTTEEVADKLYRNGYKASCYHAGLPAADRAVTQEAFLRDDIQIICATIAFGMGIDKSNVRWVMHYNLPKNLESFYQEIGRAGRDGLPGQTLLFYSFRDVMNWRDMFAQQSPERLELQIARLERMQQYAEAHLCRRRILLNYFSEEASTDCGNCDVCRQPRTRFDGTLLAQKALSAAIRLKESVNMGTLIDVLRGSRSREILEKGYDRIKTYGAGAELKTDEWREYLSQMVNTGVLDVAYHQKYAIHKGVLAARVLNGTQQVWLVRPENQPKPEAKPAAGKSKRELVKEALLDRLKDVRKRLADTYNVPPYIVFSDNTLQQMARAKPGNRVEMLAVEGVSAHKFDEFGETFLSEIRLFIRKQAGAGTGTPVKGSTYLHTFALCEQGCSPEEMARQRDLSLSTIHTHLAWLVENGYPVHWQTYLHAVELQTITGAIARMEAPSTKALFDYFGGKYSYLQIKLAQALYHRDALADGGG